jgi:hypothetical protein
MAYGTMNFFGTEYPVLKVRSEIAASDSLYISQFSFGFPFDRPLAVEYKWLTPGIKVPLLQINTTAGAQSGVLVYQTPSAIEKVKEQVNVTAFPNPMKNTLTLSGIYKKENFVMWNGMGQIVLKGNVEPSGFIDVSALSEGCYVLQVAGQKLKCIK